MRHNGVYLDYLRAEARLFRDSGASRRNMLLDAIGDRPVARVLDVGCGAGQELIPFLENTEASCVGIDVAPEIGLTRDEVFPAGRFNRSVSFVRASGETMPFDAGTFDVVICRVALPYMNNAKAISEIARVLHPQGVLFLKIHSPRFYLDMLVRVFPTLSPGKIGYPVICLAGGLWNAVTGKQPEGGFWKGKEVFQTRSMLKKFLVRDGLRVVKEMPDSVAAAPSFLIARSAS